MAITFQTLIILARRYLRLSYGPDLTARRFLWLCCGTGHADIHSVYIQYLRRSYVSDLTWTFIIFARRRQRLAYGSDLSDFHYICTAVLQALLRPWPLGLSSYLHGGAQGFLLSATFQTSIIFARQYLGLSCSPDLADVHHICTAVLTALLWNSPCKHSTYWPDSG